MVNFTECANLYIGNETLISKWGWTGPVKGIDVNRSSQISEAGCYNVCGRMKYWGARGGFWNDLWRLLIGAAWFVIPGIGRVLIAGPLTVWVVGALREPVIEDLSALGAGLHAISIPKASIRRYESAIKMHKLLLVAHGSTQEVLKSREILRSSRPEEIDVHFVDEEVHCAA